MTKDLNALDPSTAHMIRMERGQSVVRIAVCTLAAIYFFILYTLEPASSLYRETIRTVSLVLAIHSTFALAFIAWAYYAPGQAPLRRHFTPALDILPTSWILAVGGEPMMPLVAIFLTVIIGNGLRFGVQTLWLSTGVSWIGFAAMVTFSPAWRSHPFFAASIALTLVLVPPYVAHLIGRLHRSMAEAAEANRAKSEFLARMSHELRTPLHAIVSTTELLDADRLQPDQKDVLQVLRDSIDALLHQVDQVLDLSKIEAGKMEVVRAPFHLDDTLAHLRALFERCAAGQGLALKLDIAPDVPYAVMGDGRLLGHVLQNLIGNAIKFTPRGEVRLAVRTLETNDKNPWLRFQVSDTGIGMSPEFLPKVFDRFVQEDGSSTRHYGGSGLGTSISKQLVERMNGRISVQSEKGAGTTFTVDLPFEPTRDVRDDSGVAAQHRKPRVASTGAMCASTSGRMRHLLAADDNAINRLLISRILSGAGYRVTLCEDGREAYERLMSERFDLAIIDVHMPGKGGLDVALELRAAENTTPLLVLTADVTAETREKCEALSLPYLAKPVRRNTLVETIEAVLARQALPAVANNSPATDAVVDFALFEESVGAKLASPAGRDVVRRFLQDADEQRRRLSETANTRNWPELRRRLHAAKGVAFMFGAVGLARVLESYEKQSDDVLMQRTEWMLDEISLAIAETATACIGKAELVNAR
jgi:two-component system, sensor histidine kinase RpfC